MFPGWRSASTRESVAPGKARFTSCRRTRASALTRPRLVQSWWEYWGRWTRTTAETCSSTTASSACCATRRSALQVQNAGRHFGSGRFTPSSSFASFWFVLVVSEVQFRPYRTDDFITRLYYETPRFTVLNQTWVLKARVNDSERNPNLSCKRTLSFQLILKSKVRPLLSVSAFFFYMTSLQRFEGSFQLVKLF